MPTKLQAAAKAAANDKAKRKKLGLLASFAAFLGLGSDAVPAAGKMKRVTETTKHVTTEEEEGGSDAGSSAEEEESDAEEEESDAEEEEGSTGSTGSDADSTGSTHPSEEEEGAEAEEEEERGEAEEEDAKALAKATRAAYRKADAAFLAAVPEPLRASAALRSPSRLSRETRKVTGAKTVGGAMTALSRLRATNATTSAKAIQAVAAVQKRVDKLAATSRSERVNAMVAEAKTAGKASTSDLRAMLREHGNAHGTKALARMIASLPVAGKTSARLPRVDGEGNPLGAPSATDQQSSIAKAMLSDIKDPKERAAMAAQFEKDMGALNGASGTREA